MYRLPPEFDFCLLDRTISSTNWTFGKALEHENKNEQNLGSHLNLHLGYYFQAAIQTLSVATQLGFRHPDSANSGEKGRAKSLASN